MKVILIVILLVMFSPSGISCSCIITKSLKERFEASSVIAVLEVDSSVYIETNEGKNFNRYTLKTVDAIKGNPPEFYTTEVRVPTDTCTRKLEQDERVLIIKYDSSSKINASSCSPYVSLKYFEQYNPNWRWLAKNADKDQEFFDSINSEKSIIVEKLLKEPVFVDLASTFDDYLISKLERIAYADTRNIRHNERVMVGNIVQEIIESYYYQDNLVYLRGEQIVRSFLMNRFVIDELKLMDEFVKSDFGIKLIKQFNHFMFERVEDNLLEQLYQSSIQESVHKRVKEKIENVTRNSPLYRGL